MADNTTMEKKSKFSLIELLMIIMLVGIVFTLIVPLMNDSKNHDKMAEAIRNIQIIARADVDFKNNPDNGYYAFDLSMIDVDGKLEKYSDEYLFDYSLTDSTVVATTNKHFGKKGASLFYYLPLGPWGVEDNKISRDIFDPNWLP